MSATRTHKRLTDERGAFFSCARRDLVRGDPHAQSRAHDIDITGQTLSFLQRYDERGTIANRKPGAPHPKFPPALAAAAAMVAELEDNPLTETQLTHLLREVLPSQPTVPRLLHTAGITYKLATRVPVARNLDRVKDERVESVRD